jgi:hypothetical protein
VEAVHRVAGLQAQDSTGPYFGLRARLRDFERGALTAAIEAREVYVATLLRGTMHLVTAVDHFWLKPTLRTLAERLRARPGIAGLDQAALFAAARERAPARMPELRALAPPGLNPGHVADLFQSGLPLVRVPPAGTWRVGGSALQELVEVGEEDLERLVLTYLRAFGPSTARDAQTWSGLTRLGALFDRLDLERVEVAGVTYFDVPGAPRPAADAPAPVRFLPRWDNLLIAHHDRRRFVPEGLRPADVIGLNAVLVDGFVAGTWEWSGGDVEVTPFTRLPRAVEVERRRLRDWLADG